jgi:hypothetical protein
MLGVTPGLYDLSNSFWHRDLRPNRGSYSGIRNI